MRVCTSMSSHVAKQESFFGELLITFTIQKIWLSKLVFDESLEDDLVVLHQIQLLNLKLKTKKLTLIDFASSPLFIALSL